MATIFADNLSTPKANPFVADSFGYGFFYAANGRYDVQFSGVAAGIPTPYTWGDVVLSDFVSFNGLTAPAQLFAVGTAGTDFAIVSAVATHTFNLPSASATARGAVTTGAQSFAGPKTFLTPIAAGSGGTGLNASAASNGQLLIGNGTGFSLGSLGGTANQILVTGGAGTITLATPQNIDSAAAVTFASLTLSGLTASAPVITSAAKLLTSLPLTDGQLVIGRTGNTPLAATITAGTGISVTNGAGTITIAATSTGITSLNGSTTAVQTFSTGTTGTDFAIVTNAGAGSHTFNIPDASATARGLVTTGAQTLAGIKTLSSAPVLSVGATFASGITLGNFAYARSTADFTKNNNTTLADVTGLSFAIGANETWVFIFQLHGISQAAADYKFALTFPAATTAVRYGVVGGGAPAGAASDTLTAGGAIQYNGSALEEGIFLQGLVRNGANAGTVQLQMAQQTADVSNTIIRADSNVIALRVG